MPHPHLDLVYVTGSSTLEPRIYRRIILGEEVSVFCMSVCGCVCVNFCGQRVDLIECFQI